MQTTLIERTIVIKFTEEVRCHETAELAATPLTCHAVAPPNMKSELKFREKLADLRTRFPEWKIQGWSKTRAGRKQNEDKDAQGSDANECAIDESRCPMPPPPQPHHFHDPADSALLGTSRTIPQHCPPRVRAAVAQYVDDHLSALPLTSMERVAGGGGNEAGVTPYTSALRDYTTPVGAQLMATLALLQSTANVLPSPQLAFVAQQHNMEREPLPRCPRCGFDLCRKRGIHRDLSNDVHLAAQPQPSLSQSISSLASSTRSVGNIRGEPLLHGSVGLVCRVTRNVPKLLYGGQLGVIVKVQGGRAKLQLIAAAPPPATHCDSATSPALVAPSSIVVSGKSWWYHQSELILVALSVEEYQSTTPQREEAPAPPLPQNCASSRKTGIQHDKEVTSPLSLASGGTRSLSSSNELRGLAVDSPSHISETALLSRGGPTPAWNGDHTATYLNSTAAAMVGATRSVLDPWGGSSDDGRYPAATPLSPFPQLELKVVRPEEPRNDDSAHLSVQSLGSVEDIHAEDTMGAMLPSRAHSTDFAPWDRQTPRSASRREVVLSGRSPGVVAGGLLGTSGRSLSIAVDGVVLGGSAARSLRLQQRASVDFGHENDSPTHSHEVEEIRRIPQTAWL